MSKSPINLAWGTNELPELKPYWEEWIRASAEEDLISPPGFRGVSQLRERIAQRYSSRYQSLEAVDPKQILISSGGTQALFASLMYWKQKQGRVILQSPAWGYFETVLKMLDIPFERSEALSPGSLKEELESMGNAGPTLFLLTHPSNPGSHIFSKEYLKSLSEWVYASKDHYVLSDEIYDWFVDREDGYFSWTEVHGLDRSFIVHGYSKPTGLASFRVGYLLGDRSLIKDIFPLLMHISYGVASHSQYAALFAQEQEGTLRSLLRKALEKRHQILEEHLQWPQSLTHNPMKGMYAFLYLSRKEKAAEVELSSLKEDGLIVTSSRDFGIQEAGFRLNLCRSIPEIRGAVDILNRHAPYK